MACHITGVYDVNRNTTLDGDQYEWVRQWAESLAAANVQGLLFHNNFSKETCEAHQNECISFIKIDYDPRFNPNVYRYFVYREFLQNAIHSIRNLFITDVSDVTLARNPFTDPYFLEHPTSLFCGDEPTTLDNDWMRDHSAKLRESIPDFADFETRFANHTLLNCGITGGAAPVVFEFIRKLCAIHQESNIDNRTAYTGDMGAFNYLARTQYDRQLKHGQPVNTVFKQYERERIDCWFRHK
jgi:hypothetical protein